MFYTRFDAGPVRLASIGHAFNYRIAVLRDGEKPALRIGRSRRAKRWFLNDVSIPWDQQLALMFQNVSALVLNVPEASTCFDKSQSIPPNVLLSFEPWGHLNHDGSECLCLSSDRMGAYIHGLSIDLPPRDTVSSPLLSPPEMRTGEDLLCGEKIPVTRVTLCQQKLFWYCLVRFRKYLTESVHMGGCYWLFTSARWPVPYRLVIGSRLLHGELGEWLFQSMRGGGGWLADVS